MNQFDPFLGEDVVVPGIGNNSLPNSGKFYIIRFPNGQYFRAISATGRVQYGDSYSQAAKLFECDFERGGEVYEMAAKLGGQAECYEYKRVKPGHPVSITDSSVSASVSKMTLDE